MSKKAYSSIDEMFVLESLITKHRDRFELRYSKDDDLQHLYTDQTADSVKAEVREWRFISLEDKHIDDGVICFLTGMKEQHTATMTSRVVAYNAQNRFVFTHSGSVYYLEGDEANIPLSVLRVATVAATFNSWGVGQTLGMPPAFF